MKILCAPVQLHHATKKAIADFIPDIDIVWLNRGDKFAYWREIKKRWTGEDDLLIIEQDIEFGEGMVDALRDCDWNWCSFSYPCFVGDDFKVKDVCWALGFTKFSAKLQQEFPVSAILDTMAACNKGCEPGAWYHIDWHLAETIKKKYSPHVHGNVIHHHDYRPIEAAYPDDIDRLELTTRDHLMETLRARGWSNPEKIQAPKGSSLYAAKLETEPSKKIMKWMPADD